MAKHIETFMNNDYTDFAVYRVIQRLPFLTDSLGQTQRKILYVLSRLPSSKKVKTAGVYNLVYSETNYLHGDASVYTVVENLAREASNNLNLLTQEGSFGYRTNRAAAAPRYTSTRFSQAAKLIFRSEDNPILEKQEFEGSEIEPKFMLPILPVSIINGYNAIAVGFASKFLARHPVEVINELIRMLKSIASGKDPRPKNLTPIFPFFKGLVVHNTEHTNPSAWFLIGSLTKTKRKNWIEITEVPPEYTRESYIKKLKAMLEKGIIRDYNESCSKNSFKIEVKVSPELWKLSEDELLEKLGLIDKFVENFNFMQTPESDEEETIVKFDTVGEYLLAFLKERQKYYIIRKNYVIDKLTQEIKVLHEKIRFINEVNSGDIIITKRKKIDLEKELKTKDYMEIDSNYDYLLGIRVYALTKENVQKFIDTINVREQELQVIRETTSEQMHIQELQELLKFIKPELQKKGLV
jgi:DNA topoisomerase-2